MKALALLLPLLVAASGSATAEGVVAIKAGTIHLVDKNETLENGTILIVDGRISAVGASVDVPGHARVVDYGPDSVVVPGFVAADSNLGAGIPAARAASPGLRAADNFDTYGSYYNTLASGVTTVYMAPARGRLVAGQGAVVKLGGEPGPDRVLSRSAMIHGAVSSEARNTPGFWEPPVPATVDVGMGVEMQQLPKTTMGAVLALTELLQVAGGQESEIYGPYAGPELSALMGKKVPWRMAAVEENEVRALLDFFGSNGMSLVIDDADRAAGMAAQLAKANVPVIVSPSINPDGRGRDFGKGEDASWPDYALASKLAAAGCKIAIATPNRVSPIHLKFAAGIASRGGLSSQDALRAITLNAAEILGVSSRVGSIAAGKDADLVVMNGAPMDMTSSVVATWVDGEVAWKAHESEAVVLRVEELHVGDGEIIENGELLMEDGKIVEVGRRVSRPFGATIVSGHAAMPGMIDTFGHLGLEGSGRTPATSFKMRRIVEPGDCADRRVAQSGVTTVMLAPRGFSNSGAPIMAYKPAGSDVEDMVVSDPGALRLNWTSSNRAYSGGVIRGLLNSAKDYKAKWDKYQADMAKWTPPAPSSKPAEKEDDEEEEEEDEKKDDDKKKKKKKKKDKDEPPMPVTGVWVAQVEWPGTEGESRFRLRLSDEDGELHGSLRCDPISDELVMLEGTREEKDTTLSGETLDGTVSIEATTKKGKLEGKVTYGETEVEFSCEQKEKVYEVAGRGERRRETAEKAPAPKGKPKEPRKNPELEPMRHALEGKVAVIVSVERDDEILDCVKAFQPYGIKPILFGARDAYKVADEIRDHIGGILLSHQVLFTEAKSGTKRRNRYAELAGKGIHVAFHSNAEEGAMELPLMAAYAVSQGMSPETALRALTSTAADMFGLSERVGRLERGMDADVLLLDGSPLDVTTSVLRVWVNGEEVR